MSGYPIIEAICPACGHKRNIEARPTRLIRMCRSCATKLARSLKSWGTVHNESASPLYKVWSAMQQRCENPKCGSYSAYGGRGITLCQEWKTYIAFRDWAISNGYTRGLLIDRKDNNGNYEPSNCWWVTSNLSALNRRTTHRKLANVAAMKDLARLGISIKLIAALYGEDIRRVCEIRDGKKWAWVNHLTMDFCQP